MEQENKMLTMAELEKKGWNREVLYRVAHMKDTPFFRTSPKGRFYVFENKLIDFCSARRCGK